MKLKKNKNLLLLMLIVINNTKSNTKFSHEKIRFIINKMN